jgi:hypothetical protein
MKLSINCAVQKWKREHEYLADECVIPMMKLKAVL